MLDAGHHPTHAKAPPRRLRRVVIEGRQRQTLEHVRLSTGYAEDVDPHAHDRATFRLINQRKELDALREAELVVPDATRQRLPAGEGPVWETSRFSEPITLEAAVAEMNALAHRFMFFINAETARGNVIYLRYDGNYGLIEPAE
jgi:hypothetical protein